jgi:hypothetical protein
MEILQILAFFCFVWYLQHKVVNLKADTEKFTCSATNFTVMVRKLPADTSMEQVLSHFNGLYPLDQQDWKKRPPVAGTRPVQDCLNTDQPIHLGTWIAECTVREMF